MHNFKQKFQRYVCLGEPHRPLYISFAPELRKGSQVQVSTMLHSFGYLYKSSPRSEVASSGGSETRPTQLSESSRISPHAPHHRPHFLYSGP